MDLALKQEEEAPTTSSGTFVTIDPKRRALLRALSERLLLQPDTRTGDGGGIFEKGHLALPAFYTLIAGTDCKKSFDNARVRGRADAEDGPVGLPELAALLKQAADPRRDYKGARGRRLGDLALFAAHFALALPSMLRRHALADAAVRRALAVFLKAAAATTAGKSDEDAASKRHELALRAIESIGRVCARSLSRTARAERAFKLFLLQVLGGAEALTADNDFELRVVLVDCELTLLVSLVDLVRRLLPHLANPHKWCISFLVSAAGQLDQDSNWGENPDPTDGDCGES